METQENTIDMDLQAQSSVVRQMSVGGALKAKQAVVVRVLGKPMKSKNLKVRVAAIDTLSAYTLLAGFSVDANFNDVWPDLMKTIDDRTSFEPTISSLGVLRRLFRAKSLDEAAPSNFAASAGEITLFL